MGSGVFSLVPGLTFLFLAAIMFYSTVRMPKHPLFKIQTMGLAGFGAVLALIGLILFVPPVRDPRAGYFLVLGQGCRVHVPVYLVSWHVPALPL